MMMSKLYPKHSLLVGILAITIYSLHAQNYPILISLDDSDSTRVVNSQKDLSIHQDDVLWSNRIFLDYETFSMSDTVVIQLDGESIIVYKNHSVTQKEINYQYSAYESEQAHAFISRLDKDIQGSIISPSGIYNIETHEDMHELIKKNMDHAPQETEPLVSDDRSSSLVLTENTNTDTAYIRVLALYTPEVFALNPAIINKVFFDVNNGNTSFYNSNIRAKVELAYIGQTQDSEVGYSSEELLTLFMTNNDNVFDEVHRLRNRYAADICVLFINSDDVCGMTQLKAEADSAFTIVSAQSHCTNRFSFIHEIGHIAGCHHDTLTANNQYYPYGHGFIHFAGTSLLSWRTIMAYANACQGDLYCVRIPYWSSPNITYNGISTGDITRCDNARVWNQNAQRVSDFKDNPLNRLITRFDKSVYMNYAHWRAMQTIIVDSGFIADEGQIVKMCAANSITLRPGVKINEGAMFLATSKVDYNSSNHPHFVPEIHRPRLITDNQIIIAPNPASSYIRISLPIIGQHKSASISIVDISGKHQQKIINAENLDSIDNTTYQIDINSLPNGLYLVILDVDDVIYTNKFIKQQ